MCARVAESSDLWTISHKYQDEFKPLIVKVLVRSDSNADSICDDDAQEHALRSAPSSFRNVAHVPRLLLRENRRLSRPPA